MKQHSYPKQTSSDSMNAKWTAKVKKKELQKSLRQHKLYHSSWGKKLCFL
jgi:hypothetical protein